MNLLYLSPHYPAHFMQFAKSAARHGITVMGVTDQPDECLDPELRELMAGNYRVDRLENVDQVFAAAEFYKNKFGSIDRVESNLETWLETEAKLRTAYGAQGIQEDEILFMKRKSLMHQVFVDANVPCANGFVVESYEQCIDAIDGKYPVFIKPDIGSGASDTYTIRNEGDLQYFFSVKQDYDYYMEEYVQGDIESFDGLTDQDGDIVFCTSDVFNEDIHNAVAKNDNIWYYTQREIPPELEKYGRAVVKSAHIREKFFHIEFFKVNGKYQALEINMRPPGGLTTHMFNYSCDIDVYDWWARMVAGEDPHLRFERKYYCAYVGRKYDRAYKYSHDELCRMLGDKMVLSQQMNEYEWLVMGRWGYLIRSADKQDMLNMVHNILAEA